MADDWGEFPGAWAAAGAVRHSGRTINVVAVVVVVVGVPCNQP